MVRYIPEDNLSYPIYIEIESSSSGSGFILNDQESKSVYFVTARHVLFNYFKKDKTYKLKGINAKILAHCDPKVNREKIIEFQINLSQLNNDNNIYYHEKADVCIINAGRFVDEKKVIYSKGITGKEGGSLVSIPKSNFIAFENVLISNEVFIFGYPNSLGVPGSDQIDYSEPLIRKGIIAGKNKKTRTIVLDCPVYYGNSGGLVIQVDEIEVGHRKFLPIGIVSQFVPFIETWQNMQHNYVNSNIENSGYSIVTPIDTILDLIKCTK